ncbi:MAG: Hpt domain-containing protein [Silvanigrellaceae bacterium]
MELTQDMLSELKAESIELVERFAGIWMLINTSVEQGKAVARENIDELFRTLHTLKGLSEIINNPRLVSALHLMEDRLTQVREGNSTLDAEDMATLVEAELTLEKIFNADFRSSDDVLLSTLEHHAQMFCARSLNTRQSGSNRPLVNQTRLELTSDEAKNWEKYCSREEFLFALTTLSANVDDFRGRIVPIGDIIVERSSGESCLFVFAAELDQSLVEAIVEQPVKLLRKDLQALLALEFSTTSTQSATEESKSKELIPVGQTDNVDQLLEAEPSSVFENGKSNKDVSGERAESQNLASADPEMVKDFLSNARELLDSLTNSLLDLESNPSDPTTIEFIFRAAHTIKGTAGMLGFTTIETLCHALENTFDRIRKGNLAATPVLVDNLLVGWDLVRSLFDLLEQGKPPFLEITNFLAQLSAAERGVSKTSTVPREAVAKQVSAQNPTQTQSKNDTQGTIRVDLKRLDNLVNLVGELVIDRTRFARIEEAMRTRGASADLSHQMAESVLLFGRHMNEVQNIIMKVRMVAIGTVFYKFARMVRDLSRQVGKEVELVIEGGETELDKTLVEEIGDPLVHLIRNSIDHGIEPPELRESLGKSRKGIVRLSASQQGNSIAISVKDDGKGLDVERIRAKAIKNGLLSEHENPPVKEIFNLIFEPGFSTAEAVTNISGRGVGMDVVKKNIQKLKGVIELDSTPGQGTNTVIKLPITLAIVPSLMVESSGETYAIPIVNVIESIRISPSDIQRMGASQFVKLREQVIPLVNFADVLGIHHIENDFWYRESARNSTLQRRRERLVFVVIGVGHERIGLIVDRLIGQQEIVIKPLGRLLRDRSGLAGGCLLGDGRVALVLDVAEVFSNEAINRGLHARRAS